MHELRFSAILYGLAWLLRVTAWVRNTSPQDRQVELTSDTGSRASARVPAGEGIDLRKAVDLQHGAVSVPGPCRCPTLAVFIRSAGSGDQARPYRHGMRPFPESALEHRDGGRGLLSLVGITLVLLTAGIAIALLIAAAA